MAKLPNRLITPVTQFNTAPRGHAHTRVQPIMCRSTRSAEKVEVESSITVRITLTATNAAVRFEVYPTQTVQGILPTSGPSFVVLQLRCVIFVFHSASHCTSSV